MTRPLPVQTLLLAAIVAGCLPEPDDAGAGPRPNQGCWAFYEEAGPHRWQIERTIQGASATPVPGEIAAVRLDVALTDWPSQHLTDMRIELTVLSGQTLPGHVLTLALGGEPLQDASLEGAHGNEAHFDVELARDVCGMPCELSLQLSGPSASSKVPVPLKLKGTLFAFVDSTRETRSCADRELDVVVSDAQ